MADDQPVSTAVAGPLIEDDNGSSSHSRKGPDEANVLSIKETQYQKESPVRDNDEDEVDEKIIITGADAAAHLLPLRDDHDNALTFRSIVLATILSGFQAVMYQIYTVSAPLSYLFTYRSN